jgi:hypothetical protein
MANTGTTANFSIKPSDGWVAVTAASAEYMRLRAIPDNHAFYVTSGSSTPASATLPATGTITVAGGVPIANETVTVGTTTYTWKAAAAAATEVTIGADAATSATNLAAKITANSTDVTVANDNGAGVITLKAVAVGAAGNATVLTEASTNVTVSGAGTFTGGTTNVRGYKVDECGFFECHVTNSNNYYIRVIDPYADKDLRIDAFYILT